MGLYKNIIKPEIKKNLGHYGRKLFNVANVASVGRLRGLYNAATDFMDNHSGLIGKVAGHVGKKFLSQNMRDKISNAANEVIDVLPNSKLKGALIKINNAAQNKTFDKPAISSESDINEAIKNRKEKIIIKEVLVSKNGSIINVGV